MTEQKIYFGQHDSQQELDLGQYLRALVRNKATIFKSIAVVLSLILFYLFVAVPQYEANVLLQSEPNSGPQIGLSEVSESLESSNDAVLAGIEMLAARRVVGQVVDELKLDILASPGYFPIIGAGITRALNGLDNSFVGLRPPLLGLSRFAWGGEQILVDHFQVPRFYEEANFKLIVGDNGAYELFDEGDVLVIKGMVGQTSSGEIVLPGGLKGEIALRVDTLIGRSGSKFSVSKRPRATAIEELQDDLEAYEVSADSGVIELVLEGTDPEKVTRILNSITRVFMRENVQRKREELGLMLAFVNSQLPLAKNVLRDAEQRLREYHQDSGSVDVNLETSSLLVQLTEKEEQISSMELLKVDYEKNYTKEHPNYRAFANKLRQMRREKAALQEKLTKLPGTGIQAENVQQNVDLATKAYLLLLERQQEISILKAGLASDTWVVDPAEVPLEISRPHYLLFPIVAVMLGGFIGFVLVLFTNRNVEVIETPMAFEKTGLPVLATVQHSKRIKEIDRASLNSRSMPSASRFLAGRYPQDPAVEGLRDLRTALLFHQAGDETNTILFYSPVPDCGTSFLALNSAYLLAETGKRVLLIDADMRAGRLHRLLGKPQGPGLADLLTGGAEWENGLVDIELPGGENAASGFLTFLSRGAEVKDPTRLLLSNGFRQTMERLQAEYDHIIVDLPPVNGISDSAIVAKSVAAINVLVVRAGELVMKDVELAISKTWAGDKGVDGVVFNGLLKASARGKSASAYGI